ncbi:response regulator [Halalkalibacter okhensis]|uniref:Two-component response regulator n=1 Tax=Halalkalibacter okhensis TaxID=333138 RepID=A0A0B0I672_9BACI|nr:response regulator [Halalkalibacter okhensis]KHF37938.1 two-component response regulator [Halalkalibacter okhensis]
MIKVMLVDDEPIEREGISLILSKNRSNFEVVAEARNGKEAVERALTSKPDLVFMDIKMPEFDGIEAIRRIVPSLPNTKFIMVSAFDTFDYAREAMKFGIKEYLLKPSKVSEVVEAFDRMVEEIASEKQQVTETNQINRRLERVHSFIERDFIVSLIMDHVHEFDQGEWDEWLGLELKHKKGFAAVFSFESDRLHPDREEKSRWYRMLKQVLHEHSASCFIGPLTGFQVPVLVLFTDLEKEDDEIRHDFARSILHQVQKKVEQCRLYAGIGMVVSNVNHFSNSYKEAIYALELVHNHRSATYLVYNERLKQKRKELIPFEIEKELVGAIKKGDMQKGLQMFESYFQSIQQATDFQVKLVQKAMDDFFIVLTRSVKELGFDGPIQVGLGQLETTMQIKEVAKSQLIDITEQLGEWRANGMRALLVQAKEYIDSNYHKAISLEQVAEEIGISSYYLSKLFKDRFQVTFIEYLKNTRIQKAIELLLDGNMPLKEIALNVGYKDPNYFSTAFKKEVGLSPRDYRNKYHQ